MAAKGEGRQRVALAKEVLAGLMEDLSTNARAPVWAYGHHRKEDGNDLELLIPFGPKDAANISRKVQVLQPGSITRITGALEVAGQDDTGREGHPNVIILVREGKETCQGDPYAVARRRYSAGIQVQINVVGFDVTEKERQQLECIAEVWLPRGALVTQGRLRVLSSVQNPPFAARSRELGVEE